MDILNTNNATVIGRHMNIRKLLERKVRKHGDKPFIIAVDKRIAKKSSASISLMRWSTAWPIGF